jgi:predicted nucleotidyltransferase
MGISPEQGDFDEMSDIDIALEGVPSAKDFFKLYGEIDKMTEFSSGSY